MKIKIFLILILSAFSAFGMEQAGPNYNTYKATTVNGESLYNLSEKLPTNEQTIVSMWSETNKDLLQHIVPLTSKVSLDLNNARTEKKNCDELLTKKGYKNSSRSSYIFEFPEK